LADETCLESDPKEKAKEAVSQENPEKLQRTKGDDEMKDNKED